MTSRRFGAVSPIALLLLGGVGSLVACASGVRDEYADNRDWQCERADIPMGEVLRCKTASRDAKSAESSSATGGSLGIRTIGVARPKPECRDAGAQPTLPPTPPASTTPAPSADPPPAPEPPPPAEEPPPPPKEYPCTPGSSACPPIEVPPSAPPAPGNESPGPDECSQVASLPYCSAPPPPPAPPPPGGTWNCSDDASTGQTTCEGPPSCAPGSHPSSCGACVLDGDSDDCAPPSEGGCWVTGGGFVTANGQDNFGGNAKQMKDGRIQGDWTHEGHAKKNNAKGKPSYIFCRHVDEPGPEQPGGKKGLVMNQIYFGGPAEWRADKEWASGYWFDVVAKDHGEPGSGKAKGAENADTYHLTVRKMVDAEKLISGAIVYQVAGTLAGGNIQIHAPNNGHPGFQSALPTWVSLEP